MAKMFWIPIFGSLFVAVVTLSLEKTTKKNGALFMTSEKEIQSKFIS